MDSPGEILRLCRLCLVKDQVNIPIFEEQGDSREIFLKISSCLPVKVSREDGLPKKICDGCSEKLNSFYEFWSSSANAEKTLLSWVGVEEEKKESAKSLAESATLVKEESEAGDDARAESVEETKDEVEAPPAKRARRSAAVKAQINLAPDSEDEDLDMADEPLTKMEEESAESDGEDKDPSYTDMPGTSADDEQAGPSGMGKDGVEAPLPSTICQVVIKPQSPDLSITSNFQCNQCLKVFANKRYLKRHINHHLNSMLRTFKCPQCDKSFGSNYGLKCHLQVHETSPFMFGCDYCSKTFKRNKNLELHRRRHVKDFVIHCQECDQGFVCKADYVQHFKNRHQTEKERTICFVCGKDLTKGHVKRHMENVHGETGEYPCQLCGKMFDRKISQERHVRLLHNLTPQVCDVCGQEFRWRHSLKDHLKIHSGVKPYSCQFCDKAFTRSDFLKQHERTHTGQRPFECHECGKGFTQATPLKVHMRGVHGKPVKSGCLV